MSTRGATNRSLLPAWCGSFTSRQPTPPAGITVGRPTLGWSAMATERKPQLAYSELMDKMLDEDARRLKARKLISVLTHFLGRTDLSGMKALDVGCSAGFIADELAAAGARTIGADIDVPGVQKANARFGNHATFMCADGSRLPLADGSVDVCVF